MSDEHEDIEQQILNDLADREAALTAYAMERGYELDVEIDHCEGCNQTHVDEAWIWGQGWIYCDFGSYAVSFDPEPDDEDVPLMAWDCETLEEVDVLVNLLKTLIRT